MLIGDVRDGERRLTASAFLVLFGITSAHALLETARDVLFLASVPASRLGVMYLAVAVLGWLASRFGPRQGRAVSMLPLLAAAAISGGLACLLYTVAPAAQIALVHALYLWTALFAALAITHFWLDLGTVLTITQAKRLFGVIGTGSVVGALAGALVARGIVYAVDDARALVIAASALLATTAIGPARVFGRCTQANNARAEDVRARAPRSRSPARSTDQYASGAALVRRDSYLACLLAVIVTSTVALTLTDYVFKDTAVRTVSRGALPEFFATVHVALNAVALVVQLAGVGWILRALGLRALLVVPALTMATTLGFAALGGLLPALLMKGAEGALRHSLHRTSVELCYVPLSKQLRMRIKPLFDLLGQRGGQALAALSILLVGDQAIAPALLAASVVVACSIWLYVAASMRSHYLDLIRQTLDRGEFEPNAPFPAEDLALATGADARREQALRNASGQLDQLLNARDLESRERALLELCRLHAADSGLRLHRESLLRAADRELRAAWACLDARVVLESEASAAMLRRLLYDEELRGRDRLLTLVSLAHPREDFERIRRGLLSSEPELRASSRELCEHVVSSKIKGPFLLYFDELSDRERSTRVAALYELHGGSPIDALRVTQQYPGAVADAGTHVAVELGLSLVEQPPVDLSGQRLDGQDFRGRNLRAARLVGASLRGARLEDCDLSGADLERVNFEGARLDRANLDAAQLGRARFYGASATATVFTRCSGMGTEFVSSLLDDADFGHATLTDLRFSQSLLTGTRFFRTTMPGVAFRDSLLRSAVFDEASIAGATLHASLLEECSFLDVASEGVSWVPSSGS